MKFSELTQYFDKIETTSSRLAITHLLAELFKKLNIKEIDKTIYLLQGRVGPLFEKIEFGMAERLIIKASCLALSIERKLFENKFKQTGDLGKTVEEFKKQFRSLEEFNFSINEVYDSLSRLAGSSGEGSQELKVSILADLIRRIDPLSSRYIVRIPLGAMRMGFSDMTILDGLSWMVTGDKTLRPNVQVAYHVRPDLGFIARLIKEKGIASLKTVTPKIFTPIIMMRAERLSSGKEIIEKIGRCAVQSKYDGFRLQVHCRDGQVRLYSRSLEDVTYMYPDIVSAVKKEAKVNEAIFEGEAIGFDPTSGKYLPFQETVQRKRKYNIDEKAKEVPLKFFVFELLCADGKSFLNTFYSERRKKLETIIKVDKNLKKDAIILASEEIVSDDKKIEFLFDEKQDKFLTMAKIGTGLTDEEWKQLKVQSAKFKVKNKPNNYNVDKMMECDVWITPAIIVEIRADEISQSPVHSAGLAFRFPRLERFRDDKKPEETTTLKEVEKMFKEQKK